MYFLPPHPATPPRLEQCYYCWHFRTLKGRKRHSCSIWRRSLSECSRIAQSYRELRHHLVHAHTARQDHPYLCLLFLTHSSNLFWKPFCDRDFTVSSGSLYHSCFPIHPGQKRWLFPSALQQPFTTWRPLCCHPSATSFLVKEPELNQSFFAGGVF